MSAKPMFPLKLFGLILHSQPDRELSVSAASFYDYKPEDWVMVQRTDIATGATTYGLVAKHPRSS